MRLILSILIIFLSLSICEAQRTTRKKLKVKDPIDTISSINNIDTLHIIDSSMLVISGYDKPLSSSFETFFVTNNTHATITAINITFDYNDNKKRQLHAVTKNISCTIPAGETRQLSIRSWDKQNSFYYYRSVKPRRQATPYSVTHRINSILISN